MDNIVNQLKNDIINIKGIDKSLFKQTEIIYKENIRLKKITRNLSNVNYKFAHELSQTSQILQSLMEQAKHEISETNKILSKDFWRNLSSSLHKNQTFKPQSQEIYPKNNNPEDQEFLLNLIEKSSQEANEERMLRVRNKLDEVGDFLKYGEKDDHIENKLTEINLNKGILHDKNLSNQLTKNAEGIIRGLFGLLQKEQNEREVLKIKMMSMIRDKTMLGKRDTLIN